MHKAMMFAVVVRCIVERRTIIPKGNLVSLPAMPDLKLRGSEMVEQNAQQACALLFTEFIDVGRIVLVDEQ
jgi:hypothetical protein